MRIKTSFIILFMVLSAFGQAKKGGEELRFESIELYEKRSKIIQIRESFLNELSAKEQRAKNIQKLEASLFNLGKMKDGDKQLSGYIDLRRKVLDALNEIKEANGRQVELLGMIDMVIAAGDLMPQIQTYLGETRVQLRNMGTQQEEVSLKAQKMLQLIKIAISNVPPPDIFKSKSGLTFKLIRAGRNSFYVSEALYGGHGNVSLFEALKAAQELSNADGVLYRIPEYSELCIMNSQGVRPEVAVWSATKWQPNDSEAERMFGRFGVNMYAVWDPHKLLGHGSVFCELPFAKYENLDYYLVTSARTGWQARWEQVMIEMAK